MAEGADASAAWENPLMPHATLRRIYLAMMRSQVLAKALPVKQRDGLGMEACLVSTSVDLGPGDLVSDAIAGGVVQFLRGAAVEAVLRPQTARRIKTNAAGPARIASAGQVEERVWAGLGAAAALKAASARTRRDAAPGAAAPDGCVVVLYLLPGEMPKQAWQSALTFAARQDLPVVFVLLPTIGKASKAPSRGDVSVLAQKYGVPGIAVDADDAVAIYRVAQESIGHARIGGGPALMECVPFVVQGATTKAVDSLESLEQYMLGHGVAKRGWLDGERKSFARRVGKAQAASK